MCGIIGHFNVDRAQEKVVQGLDRIKNRGRDGFGLYDGKLQFSEKLSGLHVGRGHFAVGHNLHSIVSFREQPMVSKKSVLVINCEIYNWKQLIDRYGVEAKNDSELAHFLLDKHGIEIINEFDGVFALAYWKGDKVVLARDIIGVKPLWFSYDKGFCFASEKKAIKNAEELNPRLILTYNIKRRKYNTESRDFFKIYPENNGSRQKVKDLLVKAIEKRIPDRKFGLLFSGGIDSIFIAKVLKDMGHDFVCYTAALDEKSSDLIESRKVAKELGLKLKYRIAGDLEPYIRKVVPLIEDYNVVKVGVGTTFLIACEMARKDGVKVIFSGLGSEEIFAGYERHKKSANINNECLSGLRRMYERDLYRDDVITMYNRMELRLPYLDLDLVRYALRIPAKLKIHGEQTKVILREAGKLIGLSLSRPKKAAQYGSRIDKGIEKLSRKRGYKFKSDYLRSFVKGTNVRVGCLMSGGKDSFYAMNIMKKQNYDIRCFVTVKSLNPDSYMYHTPAIDLVRMQAKAYDMPVVMQETKGEKEKELADLEKALLLAKKEYKIEGVCCGAIFSEYQRKRIERVCDKIGLKVFTPLWHMDQELEMRNLIDEGFEFIFVSIAADGLDKTWLGRVITHEDVDRLVVMNRKNSLNIAGEGGEYETFVLNGPGFKRKLKLEEITIEMENKLTGRLVISRMS